MMARCTCSRYATMVAAARMRSARTATAGYTTIPLPRSLRRANRAYATNPIRLRVGSFTVATSKLTRATNPWTTAAMPASQTSRLVR